ncbi:hypothetical protein BG58_22770 [Caballeronia jiangsuensis]|nr:hypothetical protein BG58_22770 [Caballeronia jiangsuensis]
MSQISEKEFALSPFERGSDIGSLWPLKSADAIGAVRAISDLTSLLEHKIGGRRCVLLDWPNHPNVGDHLIWLGQKVILKKFLNVEIVYQADYVETDFERIAELEDTVILCHGGGNFGDLYIHHQKFRENIVRRFPEREIIFLPQTIYYQDDRQMHASSRALAGHPNLTIFTRDLTSYASAASMVAGRNVHLAIDSAFALQSLIPRFAHRFAESKRQPLYLLRQDRESHLSNLDRPENALLVDWIAEDSLDWVLKEVDALSVIDEFGLRELIDSEWELRSLVHFVRAVCLFAKASYVVTDRLHAHILALLMGVENDAHDNTYGKISAFSNAWTCDDPLVAVR